MTKRNIRQNQMAREIGVSQKSLFNKLRGITPFTWDEVSKIRETFFPDMFSDELFKKQE